MNKYRIEKVLHELIRDLPEVEKVHTMYAHGWITLSEALREIAAAIDAENSKCGDVPPDVVINEIL